MNLREKTLRGVKFTFAATVFSGLTQAVILVVLARLLTPADYGLVAGAFVIVTGISVFWDAVAKLWDLIDGEMTTLGLQPFALWVALGTVAIKVFLFLYVRKLGKDTGNPIVNALAYDHRTDILSASAASVGIFLGQRGLPWVDPLAGALVAMLILRTGIYILRESSAELMDAVPHEAVLGDAVPRDAVLLDVDPHW